MPPKQTDKQPLWITIVGWVITLFKWMKWKKKADALEKTLDEWRKKRKADHEVDDLENDIRDKQDNIEVDSDGNDKDIFNDNEFNRRLGR